MAAIRHFSKLSLAYLARPGARRKAATIWAYLKITLIDQLGLPRSTVTMFGWRISFPDAFALRWLFEEIFLGEHYRLPELETRRPLIIDAGANIGMATLYFKLHYPEARIVCVEPNPHPLAHLEKNIAENGLDDVAVHPVALGREPGIQTLHGIGERATSVEGDWALRWQQLMAAGEAEAPGKSIRVEVKPLSDLISDDERLDLLKMDIEGSEGAVLEELGRPLADIDHLVMEYHRWPGSVPLSQTLAILERNRHEYNVMHWAQMGSVSTCIISSTSAGSGA